MQLSRQIHTSSTALIHNLFPRLFCIKFLPHFHTLPVGFVGGWSAGGGMFCCMVGWMMVYDSERQVDGLCASGSSPGRHRRRVGRPRIQQPAQNHLYTHTHTHWLQHTHFQTKSDRIWFDWLV